jgi:hypothetical protein
MTHTFIFLLPAWVISLSLFLLIIIFYQLGYWYKTANRKLLNDEDSGAGEVTGNSMLALIALLLAFTFNMTASKFESRQHILTQEVNDVGTAMLRCDLYPDSLRSLLLDDFTIYVDARIKYYAAGDEEDNINQALKESDSIATSIWQIASGYSLKTDNRVPSLLMIPALNNMFDTASARDAQRVARVPPIILLILLFFMFLSGFYLGYKQKTKWSNSLVVLLWALAVTLTIFVMLELDRPKRGLINLDNLEMKMEQIRDKLHARH